MFSRIKVIGLNFVNKLKYNFSRCVVFLKKFRIAQVSLLLLIISAGLLYARPAYAFDLINEIFNAINWLLFLIASTLGWIDMMIFKLIIVFSSYNDFVTSKAVTKGWVLIRDICNLMFVLILLYVAFANILQANKEKLSKLVYKIIMAAVLVNFSKLFCGLVIDFAQVVQMTFVNGYAATAGANLINGLGLSQLLQTADAVESSGGKMEGPDNADIFLALVIGIFMLIMTGIVAFFIALLFIMRIAQLWILIVLSPLAFAGSVLPFKSLQGEIDKWWKNFGWSVAIGPVMAFFLWLSLLMMSNPGDMIQTNTSLMEKQNAGMVSKFAYLDNISQAAIGLVLLMASLVVAQQAGGMVGKAAAKYEGYARTAAKSVASKMSGYGAVMSGYGAVESRAKAVYGGFMAKQKAKKEAKMAAYVRVGEKAFGLKEKGIGAAKKAVSVATAPVRAGLKYAHEKTTKKAGKYIKEKYQAAGKYVKESSFGGKVARAWERGGTMEDVAQDAIDQEHRQKALKSGQDKMRVRGISKPEDLRKAMMDWNEDSEVRRAAAHSLAQKAAFEDEKDKDGNPIEGSAKNQVKTARELLSGDRQATKEFDEKLQSKRADLAFDFDKPADKEKFERLVREGELDVGRQNAEAYADPKFMEASRAALGDEGFAKAMQGVAERPGEKFRTVVTDSVVKMATKAGEDEKKAGDRTKIPVHGTEEETRDIREKLRIEAEQARDKAKNLRTVAANVLPDLDVVYGERDSAGQLKKDGAGNVVINDKVEAELREFVKKASGKKLAKKNLSPNVVPHVAVEIKANQLAEMASSGETGAEEKVNLVVKAIVDAKPEVLDEGSKNAKMKEIAGNQKVMSCLDDKVRQAIEAAKPKPAESSPPPPAP